jgi:hypothetical protein
MEPLRIATFLKSLEIHRAELTGVDKIGMSTKEMGRGWVV